MDWQEKYLDKLDHDISEIKTSLYSTEERITRQITQIVEQALSELRERDNQRHIEILELNKKIDSKIESIDNKLDGTLKWIIAMALSTIIGVAAMVITVLVSR